MSGALPLNALLYSGPIIPVRLSHCCMHEPDPFPRVGSIEPMACVGTAYVSTSVGHASNET